MILSQTFSATTSKQLQSDSTALRLAAENKLKAHVYTHRVALEELFVDFDRLNSGRVTVPQFTRSLVQTGAVLTEAEVQSVIEGYQTKANGLPMVNWREFVDSINSVFSYSIKERSPSFPAPNASEFLSTFQQQALSELKEAKKAEVTEEELKILETGLADIRRTAYQRRILVKTYFKDHDTLHRGTCSVLQFRRTLSTLGWNLPDKLVELLVWKYSDCTSLDTNVVNYRKFLADVDPPSADIRPSDLSDKRIVVPAQEASAELADDEKAQRLEKLLTRIRVVVARKGVHMSDLFIDYDKLRTGAIAPSRLRASLNTLAQIDVSDQEMKLLHEKYVYENDQSKINYERLATDVTEAFTSKKLQYAPLAAAPSFTPVDDDEGLPLEQMSEKSRAVLEAVLSRLATQVAKRGIGHKPFFQSHDRTNRGYITQPQLASTLKSLQLQANTEELAALHLRFRKGDRVKYLALCAELEARASLVR